MIPVWDNYSSFPLNPFSPPDVVATDDASVAFKDIDAAFLVGAMPRKEGMERKDLLAANVKIFKIQVRNGSSVAFQRSDHNNLSSKKLDRYN